MKHPVYFTPEKSPGTHVQEDKWALRFGLISCRKSYLHPVLNPDPFSL